MDIYSAATKLLLDLHIVNDWAEMHSLIQRAASRQPRDWYLPVMACRAVGGEEHQAIAGVAAIACMQISIILIDDMLDSDPRGDHHRLGSAVATNLAAAFQAAALEVVAQSDLSCERKIGAMSSVNQMALTTARGQHLDAQNPSDETAYWNVTKLKSSPFFGAALHVGALMGGGDIESTEGLKRMGYLYGEMIQIHDDLKDTMATPANPDWIEKRSPLPILFAQSVDHPQRERFLQLRNSTGDPIALEEAQTILIRCGAVSFCVDQLVQRHRLAREMIQTISLANRDEVEEWIDAQIVPIQNLFESVGVNVVLQQDRFAIK